MSSLLAREIALAIAAIEAGGDVDPGEVLRLLARVRSEAGALRRRDVIEVQSEVGKLQAAVQRVRDGIAKELSKRRAIREAMHGYGHLRGAKVQQRLFRKA